jgi:hypothetical protein
MSDTEMPSALQVNSPTAACQIIDGEAVLIHFDSGRYFSSLGSGSEVIRLLELGHTLEQIIEAFCMRYADATSAGEVGDGIRSFVEQLLDERLFIADPAGAPAQAVELAPELESGFVAPRLEKYSELDDLLKLDPIHDADPAGWPLREVRES